MTEQVGYRYKKKKKWTEINKIKIKPNQKRNLEKKPERKIEIT